MPKSIEEQKREIDERIAYAESRLKLLRDLKKKEKVKQVKKNSNPVGRPRLSDERIKLAKELAKTKPLPDVADYLEIALSSLYRYGIKREILNAEKLAEENKSKCDSPSEISSRSITD